MWVLILSNVVLVYSLCSNNRIDIFREALQTLMLDDQHDVLQFTQGKKINS